MRSNIIKNLFILGLLGVTLFGVLKFQALHKVNQRNLSDFYQLLDETADFLEQRENLLSELEKERRAGAELRAENEALIQHVRASHRRLSRLFQQYKHVLGELEVQRAEAGVVKGRNQRLTAENTALRAKLSSLKELKLAIRKVKRDMRIQARERRERRRTDTGIWGNGGYLMQNGVSTHTSQKIKIEVSPARL
ncbi:MAG: hypothetical protein MJA29_07900 [Candidatus Omnitrophica bacterium]|nr:hypothetical protein [Candidatus Omnitrophota bacterium]